MSTSKVRWKNLALGRTSTLPASCAPPSIHPYRNFSNCRFVDFLLIFAAVQFHPIVAYCPASGREQGVIVVTRMSWVVRIFCISNRRELGLSSNLQRPLQLHLQRTEAPPRSGALYMVWVPPTALFASQRGCNGKVFSAAVCMQGRVDLKYGFLSNLCIFTCAIRKSLPFSS